MTSLQTPKLVIFDCDGVLVDSEELANRVLVGMLTSHGLNLSLDEAIRFFSGFTPEDTVAKAEGMLGRALPKNFWQETQSKTFRFCYRIFWPSICSSTGRHSGRMY